MHVHTLVRNTATLLLFTLLVVACTSVSASPGSERDEASLTSGSRGDVAPGGMTSLPSPTTVPTLTPLPSPTTPPTITAEPTATREPTITPRPQPTEPRIDVAAERARSEVAARAATATAVAALAAQYADVNALPPRIVIQLPHEYQRRNNCAPTTTSMVVRYYGLNVRQADLAALQKPVPEDVNVTAEEVAVSIRELGLNAYVGHNGNIDMVIRLLAAGFPVIAEEWIDHDGGMGHFRAIRGYDREQQRILYNDSFYGADLWRSYSTFLRDWAPYNNKFVIPYRTDQEALLKALIGDEWEESGDYAALLAVSTAQTESNPRDGFAWWGKGEALLRLGRPEEAITAFETALATNSLPWRYLWYRYGYFEALNQVGRYEDLLEQSRSTLNQMVRSEDLRYHRAVAYRAMGDIDNAILALEMALQDNPRFIPARVMLEELRR